jgi:hypothetical protein
MKILQNSVSKKRGWFRLLLRTVFVFCLIPFLLHIAVPASPAFNQITPEDAGRFGYTTEAFERFQVIAREQGVMIRVRPGNEHPLKWIKRGYSKKPKCIKNKTIKPIDIFLHSGSGGPSLEHSGLVGHFKPYTEKELWNHNDDIKKKWFEYKDYPGLDNRQRIAEWENTWRKMLIRRNQRDKEYVRFNKELEKNVGDIKSKCEIDPNGVILDKRQVVKSKPNDANGKAFTGGLRSLRSHEEGKWQVGESHTKDPSRTQRSHPRPAGEGC